MFNHSQFSMSVAVEDGAKGRRQSVLKEDFKQLKLHRKHHNSDFKRVVDVQVSLSDESFCIVIVENVILMYSYSFTHMFFLMF